MRNAPRASKLDVWEQKDIAEQAYIYAFPMIANYKAMYQFSVDRSSSQYKAPFNQIWNASELATPKDTAVVTPNADTPYSILNMDLRAEPMVLCVPRIEQGRYYSVQLIDMYTFNYGYIGSRTTGNGAGCYMVAGPGWKGETPPGIDKVFRCETDFSLAIYRTQVFNAADMKQVRAIQDEYKVYPLSKLPQQWHSSPRSTPVDFPPFTPAAFKTEFIKYLNFLLQYAPTVPEEKELRAHFAEIGIGPGKRYDYKSLPLEDRLAVGLGVRDGYDRIKQKRAALGYRGEWLADKLGIRRPRLLQRQVAGARRRGDGGTLWQRSGRGAVPDGLHRRPRRNARRWQVSLHADLPERPAAARQRLLVGHHVRRQIPAADHQSDQPLPDQLGDATEPAEEPGRVADSVSSVRSTRKRHSLQLAAGAQPRVLRRHAPLLAQASRARRQVGTSPDHPRQLTSCRRRSSAFLGGRRSVGAWRGGEGEKPRVRRTPAGQERISPITPAPTAPTERRPPKIVRRMGCKAAYSPAAVGLRCADPQLPTKSPRTGIGPAGTALALPAGMPTGEEDTVMQAAASRVGSRPRVAGRGKQIAIAAVAVACGLLLGGHFHAAVAGVNLWTNGGPEGAVVITLAVDPMTSGIVYAGTAGKGVFKSTDGGATWHSANNGLGNIYVEDLLVDPNSPTTLYAASPNNGVFKSIDGADNWAPVNAGLSSSSAHLLALDANTGTVYVNVNDGLFQSFDGGGFWLPTGLEMRASLVSGDDVALPSALDCLAVDRFTGALYACVFTWVSELGLAWELRKSVDGGASWDTLTLPTSAAPYAIAIESAAPATIYVATLDVLATTYAVIKSMDGGDSWQNVGATMPGCVADCRISALAVDTAYPCTLYAATDKGVYTIAAGADQWTPLNTGIAGTPVITVAVESADPASAYAGTSGGVFAIHQAPGCRGDCDGNQVVSVDELIAAVGIALGRQSMPACAAADAGTDGEIAVSDIVAAVDNALLGCADANRP